MFWVFLGSGLLFSTSFIAFKMSIHQTNKDKPRAQKCRHFSFSFDLHNYCPTCREAGKSDDPCVTSEAPCDICASFTDDQMKKIQHRKRYLKKQKADTNTKVDELDLLGEGNGDFFTCSNADLESAADNLFTSHPHPLIPSCLGAKPKWPSYNHNWGKQDAKNSGTRPFGTLPCSSLNLWRKVKTSSSKKAPLKTLRVLYPIKISPFVVPTTREEAPTGNAPTPHKAVTNRFPQEGGNWTSEAPGVVFDPIIGEEGVETPLPNDSSKASLSPPVGGRLRSFRRDWQTNKCSPNVLNIITNGYILPFLSKPNLVRFPLILSEYKAHQKDQALATCIKSLLSKNAIERVENVKSLGFYSRLFLVPKPHQRWRPVIDLSRLNTFLHVEKFKMETPESIRTSLIPGEWVSSIDLSDAYLHIPIQTQGNT